MWTVPLEDNDARAEWPVNEPRIAQERRCDVKLMICSVSGPRC
jgi:hypothetical protein